MKDLIKKMKAFLRKLLIITKYKMYSIKSRMNKKREYILFGTPLHGNIGDQAITIAECELLKDNNIKVYEVSSFQRHHIISYLRKNLSKNAIILINGGGFVGSQWIREEEMVRDVITNFGEYKIIIFPQTVYYKDDIEGKREFEISKKIYNSHNNLTICTRENISYKFVKENFTNVKPLLVPDIVLYLNEYNFNYNRENALICFRSDCEKNISNVTQENIKNVLLNNFEKIDYTDTVIGGYIYPNKRTRIFLDKLKQFSRYKIVVTDRLHGMIFALLTKTPCIVLGNYNYKIKGVYEWIKGSSYIKFIENVDKINNEIEDFIKLRDYNSFNIKDEFKPLVELLKY